MKVLLFGARGQVGRALVGTRPDGTELLPVDRSKCDLAQEGDVASIIAANRPDLVINAAAYTAVDRAESEPGVARLINGAAPGWIAAAASAVGARTIHLSTDFVFDGRGSRPYRPDHAMAPLGVYGRTKAEGELAVATADSAALIVRTAWVYADQGTNFVRTMLRLMRERDQVRVVADQIGTPTHARSLAHALWLLIAGGHAGIHHYTDAGTASWYDFAMAIGEEGAALGLLEREPLIVPISTEDYPTPALRPAYSVLDKTATWSALGGVAPHWRVSLRRCLREISAGGTQ